MEATTILEVGFEDGESVKAFFFTEPDTLEEQTLQSSWKSIQNLFRFCFDQYGDCADTCETCSLVRAYILSLFVVVIVFPLYMPAGLVLVPAAFALLAVLTSRWHKGRDARALRDEQRRILNPIQQRLLEFAECNDFAGALDYAFKVSGLGT
jgi:hypothetical protein